MGLLVRSSPLRGSTEGEGVVVTVREGGSEPSDESDESEKGN